MSPRFVDKQKLKMTTYCDEKNTRKPLHSVQICRIQSSNTKAHLFYEQFESLHIMARKKEQQAAVTDRKGAVFHATFGSSTDGL